MIHDGYNKFYELDGIKIIYRPALRHERMELANRLYFLQDEELAKAAYRAEIRKRVLNLTEWEHLEDALFKLVMGIEPKSTEREDARNLAEGVRFHLQNPQFGKFTCDDCRKWWMDMDKGEVVQRGGKPQPRPAYAKLLCETHEGCPRGTPENPKDLSSKNKEAFRHYLECRAVGRFPDDAIVRQNARIIAKELAESKRFSYMV